MEAQSAATPSAIDRAIFSYLYFEEEDRILDQLDKAFQEDGWVVGALIYDALRLERREGLAQAMRAAEAAVRQNLGYSIALHEE